jgi:CRP/FNR family transcriptional regulator, cyclic AMP receptor protein
MGQSGLESEHSKSAQRKAVLAESPWFANLSDDTRAEISPQLVMRNFTLGETLFAQAEAATGLYGILSGTVQTVGTSAEGIQSLLSILRPGDWTGFIGILSGQPNSFSTVASSPVETVYLPRSAANAIFLNSPQRLMHLARPIMELLRFVYRYLSETNGRAPKRVVAQRLMDLSRCVHIPGTLPSGKLESVSQDDIAAATYLTRPTVNRILQQFAKSGIVTVGYARIDVADIPALQSIANNSGRKPTLAAARSQEVRLPPSQSAPKLMTQERVRDILSVRPWFASLSSSTRDAIISRLLIRRLAIGEMLYCQDDPPEGLFAALSGQLRASSVAADGRRSLMSIVHPGDWTGFIPLFDGGTQPLDCYAARQSVAAVLPLSAVREIFSGASGLRSLLVPPVATLGLTYNFVVNTNGRPPGRLIAQRLHDLAVASYMGTPMPRDFIDNISQTDIAEATGLSRPSVNRVLGELAQLGILTLGYGRVTIANPDALLRYAQGKFS